ncbi:MAG TPA: hypothetical protein OIM14_05180 [Oscillospiraceae bacterium]|nr:hypothetical protein [Oscillospiraceae bacterium]
MAKTNTGLVAYAKANIGNPYWYGTFGQVGTQTLLDSKRKQYPSFYTSARYAACKKDIGKRVHDCVGLIKGYLWSDSTTAAPKYNAAQDVSANGMLSKCTEHGNINKMPEIPGVLVFMDGHVGVYEGNGYVIECTVSCGGGVVRTALKSRHWVHWGKCPWISYNSTTAAQKPSESTSKPTSGVKVGDKVRITGTNYATGQHIPAWVKLRKYTVSKVQDGKALLKEISSWVHTKDITVVSTAKKGVAVGSTVTIKKGAVYGGCTSARGKAVPSAQLAPTKHKVSKIQTNKGVKEALLGDISSWVAVASLEEVTK